MGDSANQGPGTRKFSRPNGERPCKLTDRTAASGERHREKPALSGVTR
jgi:hypothetical protein